MAQGYDNNFAYAFNKAVLSEEQMKEIDTYMKEYADKPDRYIMRELIRVKAEVTPDVLNQHIKNLDHLSQMEGFVTEDAKKKIDMVKRALTTNTPGSSRRMQQSNPETQFFFGGSSLLLWFLALTAIWRRPYYGYPGGGYGYPGFGYPGFGY